MAAPAFNPSLFQDQLLQWFDEYGRKHLPWQTPRTPYRVWLSEIMLQQTQVATVTPYFQRFVSHFPTIESLATAEIDQVLSLWSGLGYYARARYLHRAAQIIMTRFRGALPATLEELLCLPGIGRSTAGAILSLGFNQPAPILDGNVKRLFARLHAVEGSIQSHQTIKQLWLLADTYCLKKRPCDYTQALMDFGSLICTKTTPKCSQCPFKDTCIAYQTNATQNYPQPRLTKTLPQKSTAFLILINTRQEILLQKRPPSGIWGGLWSVPECQIEEDIEKWCQSHFGFKVRTIVKKRGLQHTFSHFKLHIHPFLISIDSVSHRVQESNVETWINYQSLNDKGLAAPVRKILESVFKKTEV